MTLKELEKYNTVTVQCHDNPDADALASGFAMYKYFSEKGKKTRFIYSGRFEIQKSNLKLMIEKLNIPVEYTQPGDKLEGLLIMVDCQYGNGNVTRFEADAVAVIDHHQIEMVENEMCEIHPELGSCSTLCWKMMVDEKYDFKEQRELGTALFYGLYTDTNEFSEIYNPVDLDMRDGLTYNRSLITLFRNSNISLSELETAGIALIRNIYNENHRFTVIKAGPCDPNILGVISDFLLQVDGVDVCLVYNEIADGFKLSVRSCIKEVKANELADYICEGIGSGGGHKEKAGGFISKSKYDTKYPCMHSESYFGDRIHQYFEETEVMLAAETTLDTTGMKMYEKKKLPVGYVVATDVFPLDTPIIIRTMEGDVELKISEELIIMIGVRGEIYPSDKERFSRSYQAFDEPYRLEDSPVKATYMPKVTNKYTGEVKSITSFARKCISTGRTQIYVKELDHYVKIFTEWDPESYMLGKPGDYISVRTDNEHDIYVIEHSILGLTYDEVK